MLALLALAFLVVPIIELAVIIKVGAAIGVLDTIGLLILSSIVGSWLMKREGLGVLRRIQASMAAGRVPGKELVDAFLILLGGALMVAPGFITDIAGMALLLPPVRAGVRGLLRRRFEAKVLGGGTGVIDV
ncbi:MAG: FxsA family protein [Actinomycetia bacterium]|nr:FxsA family protein [Actinomycetes bacterium]